MARKGKGETAPPDAPPEATFQSERKERILAHVENIRGLRKRRKTINEDVTSELSAIEEDGIPRWAVNAAIKMGEIEDIDERETLLDGFVEMVQILGVAGQHSFDFGFGDDDAGKADGGGIKGTITLAGIGKTKAAEPDPVDFEEDVPAKPQYRAEGRAAGLAGSPKNVNPYEGAEGAIWEAGWSEGRKQAKAMADAPSDSLPAA